MNVDQSDQNAEGENVDTMLVAAMRAAFVYRNTFGVDGLTLITNDGVRTAPVAQTMSELRNEDNDTISQDAQEVWNSTISQIQTNVDADREHLWFASKRNKNLDVWRVSLETCEGHCKEHTA